MDSKKECEGVLLRIICTSAQQVCQRYAEIVGNSIPVQEASAGVLPVRYVTTHIHYTR